MARKRELPKNAERFSEEFESFFRMFNIRPPGYSRANLDASEESVKHLRNVLESLYHEWESRNE